MVIGNAAAGLWALGAHRWEHLRHRALWVWTVAAEVAIFVQIAVGVAAMQVDGYRPTDFHMFYGFVAIVAVAILYSYRAQLAHRLYLLYGLGGLFLMGLGIRAMVLHP